MVPEPSIMFPPKPFIDVVTTGCEAEYMATRASGPWGGGAPHQDVVTHGRGMGGEFLAGSGARRCMQPPASSLFRARQVRSRVKTKASLTNTPLPGHCPTLNLEAGGPR